MLSGTYEIGTSDIIIVTFPFLLFDHPFQKSSACVDKPGVHQLIQVNLGCPLNKRAPVVNLGEIKASFNSQLILYFVGGVRIRCIFIQPCLKEVVHE